MVRSVSLLFEVPAKVTSLWHGGPCFWHSIFIRLELNGNFVVGILHESEELAMQALIMVVWHVVKTSDDLHFATFF